MRFAQATTGILVAAICLVAACEDAPSDEDIRQEFDRYVQTANHCTTAAECSYAIPGCPLGCFVAVRTDRKEDVERRARALIERTGRGSCEYRCPLAGRLACVENRCADRAP